jgi:hypothetical protein
MSTGFYKTPGFRKPSAATDNAPPPDQRSWRERARDQIITWFGDVKAFKPLPFLPRMLLVYDPGSYQVSAAETRALEGILLPGDILLRGYTFYLDGMVIPGFYSHAALYLGEITEADLNAAGHRSEAQAAQENMGKDAKKWARGFATGKHMVAHSMAEGVFTEDLIGFCRADYVAVLRLPRTLVARSEMPPYVFTDKETSLPEAVLQERLLASGAQGLSFVQDALPIVRQQALSRLGAHYDFGFNFRNFNDMSCTEYVHWCLRALQTSHGIYPRPHKVLLTNRTMITPDDVMQVRGSLEHVWASAATSKAELRKLGWRG